MKRSVLAFFALLLTIALLFSLPAAALAQDEEPTPEVQAEQAAQPETEAQPLTVYTAYPGQLIGFGEVVTIPIKLRASMPQTVELEVLNLPEGWTASFRGGSQIVDSVYVDGTKEASVDLRLETPDDVKGGEYSLAVAAASSSEEAELPLRFTVKDRLPPRLSLTVDGLPNKRGSPSTTFSFSADLKNEGGEDLVVSLSATEPQNVRVTIKSSGQEVNELELAANETKSLTIEADPLIDLETGNYPFTVQATAGDVQTEIELVAEVVGEGNLNLSAPDGRLSGEAVAGEETPLKLLLTNSGTAPLRGIELSSREPSGWSVSFDQQQIAEIPAGESVEVTARITPPEKAVAGDYVITFNARPLDTNQESAEFRITVRTATLWGMAGIVLIAVAVGVVGLAVVRFGRR